jgi:hypothetical protein
MKHLTIFMLLVLGSIFLAGCTGNAVYLKDAKAYTLTDPKTIRVYALTVPSVKYEVVGYVSTYSSDANHEGDLLKNNLKIQAAKYGANAIIGFRLNMAEKGGGAQGVAIRYLP